MTAPIDLIQIRKNALIYQLALARAEIARLADFLGRQSKRIEMLLDAIDVQRKELAQARTDLQVAHEIIEQQRAALDAVRAALPLDADAD